MGWKEEVSDDENYAPLTEDELREFRDRQQVHFYCKIFTFEKFERTINFDNYYDRNAYKVKVSCKLKYFISKTFSICYIS